METLPTVLTELWHTDEPNCIVTMVPERVQQAIAASVKKRPEMYKMDEQELYKALKNKDKPPTATLGALRIRFWMEYEQACGGMGEKSRNFIMANVYRGICSRESLYSDVITDADKMAWIMKPPVKYEIKMLESLHFAVSEVRAILELPNEEEYVTKTGKRYKKRDNNLMKNKVEIAKFLDQRVQGAVTQKHEHKNLNVNIKGNVGDVPLTPGSEIEELEKRLEELKKKSSGEPEAIEVKSEEVK